MKLRMLTPEMIMTVIVALILFGVGIFAVFSVATGIGSTSPSPNDDSYYSLIYGTNGSTAAGAHTWSNNATDRLFISCPGYRSNVTTAVILEIYSKNTSTWSDYQTAGNANGTWISANSTYRIQPYTYSTSGNRGINWATAFRVNYQARDLLKAGTYLGIKNSTSISNNVFNIVGIILIVGAIMLIITIVYGYIRPGRFGGV